MLLSSKGIVLQTIKYGDNASISKVLSKERGIVSLISNRSKSKKNKTSHFFQPLSAIHFVCTISNKSNIHRLKEVSFDGKVPPLSEDVAINALRFFLAEFLSKVIKEEAENPDLYQFIEQKLIALSLNKVEPGTFHVQFLIELFDFLGIQPNLDSKHSYFDWLEGSSCDQKPMHSEYSEESTYRLLLRAYSPDANFTKKEKSQLLSLLINYYNIQLGGGLDQLKSRPVLELVFS